ncbi:MAG: DUF2723 domain-containing protein [bacterium]
MKTFRTEDYFISLFLFLFFCGMYAVSGYGMVAPYRDSGDLVVAAYSLGIPHPPGYVLYILCGKIIAWALPWGNMAYRINFFSVICGAWSVSFLYLILRHYARILPSLTGAGCFAMIPSLWRLSQVSEMYSFNLCIAAFILLWLVKDNKASRCVSLTALMCGVGVANHQTLMFFFPGYALLMWYKFFRGRQFKHILKLMLVSLGFFFAGICIHLFLPIRSLTEPLLDWGNPESLRNFWRMVSRSDYGLLKLHPEEKCFGLVFYGHNKTNSFFWACFKNSVRMAGLHCGIGWIRLCI